jgi:leukotriene-A4 hydrolase
MAKLSWSFILLVLLFNQCTNVKKQPTESISPDPHSFSLPDDARVKHLSWKATVDFDAKVINAVATWDIEPADDADLIIFDTKGLNIKKVTAADGKPLEYRLADPDSLLGQAMAVLISKDLKKVVIEYQTSPGAEALQWLSPSQTAGKKQPFLFTQSQAILARSWVPCQDSPAIRFTYDAEVRVPKELLALMSASNPQQKNDSGVYTFEMRQPIPSYLLALTVGDIAFKSVSGRAGVYAEPSVVEAATWEFADLEKMIAGAEALYGKYAWDRYDVIVLPPSFPFGGMENPRLTFATPTLLAGDRSLTSVIAHELAHSWSGNLVTNATWNDFWLNEGFTVYFENRIVEAVYGNEYAQMLHLLGNQDLEATLARVEATGHPEDTHLRLHLEGRDPDDGMTDIAYEKGFAFLKLIEQRVGRERFDTFLRGYFDSFAFQSMTTDRFLDYLNTNLLAPNKVEIDVAAWVDGPGLPADRIMPVSDRFKNVENEVARWGSGTPARQLVTAGWSTQEWMHFVRHLPKGLSTARMAELDDAFGFTATGNAEVLAAWLEHCIANNYAPADARLEEFLTSVGRRKFLVPLYKQLMATERGQVVARTIYSSARSNYHAVSARTVDELLSWKETAPPASF